MRKESTTNIAEFTLMTKSCPAETWSLYEIPNLSIPLNQLVDLTCSSSMSKRKDSHDEVLKKTLHRNELSRKPCGDSKRWTRLTSENG